MKTANQNERTLKELHGTKYVELLQEHYELHNVYDVMDFIKFVKVISLIETEKAIAIRTHKVNMEDNALVDNDYNDIIDLTKQQADYIESITNKGILTRLILQLHIIKEK